MGELYQYLSDFFPHWLPLVTAGGLFGLDAVAERYWPWLKLRLDVMKPERRKKLEYAALVVAVFYSGFAAWSDEHTARVAAYERSIDASAREIIRVPGGKDFEDRDTANQLLLVDSIPDKPTIIRLTANPRIGQTITVNDEGGHGDFVQGNGAVIIMGNGHLILGASGYPLPGPHASVPLTYTGTEWIIE